MKKSDAGFVSNGDINIYYQVVGSGEPLLLLMGFGADGNLWEKHAEVYSQHFQCIILDNRGVGKSGAPPGPYTTPEMASDALAVLDHLQIQKAHVAGISMGGAIAQELCLHFPDRVASLLLISTWPRFNNYAKEVYDNLKALRKTSAPDAFMQLLQLWIFAPPHYEKELPNLKKDQKATLHNEKPQSESGFDGQLDACISHDAVSRLPEITCPTMITIGLMDIFTPPAFSELLHEGIKHAEYVTFPEGGHVHHWEDLERFNEVTLEFLLKNKISK